MFNGEKYFCYDDLCTMAEMPEELMMDITFALGMGRSAPEVRQMCFDLDEAVIVLTGAEMYEHGIELANIRSYALAPDGRVRIENAMGAIDRAMALAEERVPVAA